VPAGSYGLYTIPNAASWTIILSKVVSPNGLMYKQTDDFLRFEAKPKVAPARERMTFLFSDFGDNAGTLDLEWRSCASPS